MPQISVEAVFGQNSRRWVLDEEVFLDQAAYEQAWLPISQELDRWMERNEDGVCVVWDSEGRPSTVLEKHLGRLLEQGKAVDVSVAMTEREEMVLSLPIEETPAWLLEPEPAPLVRRPKP